MDQPKLPQGVTPEEVKRLIAKHGTLYPITVSKDGKTYVGLFKKPTLVIISAAMPHVESDPLKAGETIYNNCKVAIDPEIDQDDELKVGVMGACGRLFQVAQAQVGEPFV